MGFIPSGGSGTGAGTEVGYDQITAPVTVSSTTEATGTTVITCAAHTFDGSPVLATFFSPAVQGGANSSITVCLFEGATEIGRFGLNANSTGIIVNVPFTALLRFTPTAGSHTYTVTAFMQAAASGTVAAGAGGTGANMPAFIRFTKV